MLLLVFTGCVYPQTKTAPFEVTRSSPSSSSVSDETMTPVPIYSPLPPQALLRLNQLAMEEIRTSPIRSASIIAVHHIRLDEHKLFDEILNLPPSRIPPLVIQLTNLNSVKIITDQLLSSDYGLIWTGHIQNDPTSSALFRVDLTNRTTSGEVRIEEKVFEIRPGQEKSYGIFVIDTRKLPPDHSTDWNNTDPGKRVPRELFPTGREVHSLSLFPSVIDVMVLYTQNAINANPLRNIADHICAAMVQIEKSFIDSGVTNAKLRLVHHQQITFPESGNIEQDTINFRDPSYPSRAGIQDYFPLRTTHGADLMNLWVGDGNTCGDAEAIVQPGGSGVLAFSVVRRNCATTGLAFAHELGHLMGTYHDRFNAQAGDSPSRNYGYTLPEKKWREIMGLNRKDCNPDCNRLLYWSNPDKSYPPPPVLGDAMGRPDIVLRTDCTDRTADPTLGTKCDGPANNVVTLNNNAETVAKFTASGMLGNVSCGPVGAVTTPVPPAGLRIQ